MPLHRHRLFFDILFREEENRRSHSVEVGFGDCVHNPICDAYAMAFSYDRQKVIN
jgi:hypothetical protein